MAKYEQCSFARVWCSLLTRNYIGVLRICKLKTASSVVCVVSVASFLSSIKYTNGDET